MPLLIERVTATGPYGRAENGRFERSYRPQDPNKVIASWYADPKVTGVLFGVQHAVVDIDHYIVTRLIPAITAFGVHDVYVEERVTWQDDFESFRDTGTFPAPWEEHLTFINDWNGGYADQRPLYHAIRQTNIRLHFLDAPEGEREGRDAHMMEVFRRRGPEGKFLVICGAAHAAKGPYMEFHISSRTEEVATPLGSMINAAYPGNIRAVTAIGMCDYKYYPLYSFFNETLPNGHPPIALNISEEVFVPNSVLFDYKYHEQPLQNLYDAMVFFPHATFD